MVAITRIPPAFIFDRLDGRYNSPSAVAIRKKIQTSGIEISAVSSLFELVCGPFGSTLTADEHSEDGEVLLIQPTNISGDIFSEASSWRIKKRDLVNKGLKLYSPGTLLFARVGVYPHTGILPEEAGMATISSSMIAGIPRKNIDTHYVCAFFKSRVGFQLLLAAQKVTAQPTIGTTEIGATDIPAPDALVQKYIGDKARQAERLRAWAVRAQEVAVREMPAYKAMIRHYAKSSYRVSTDTLLSARLDSSFFHPDHLALDSKMKESRCQYFGKVASAVKPGWNKKSSDSFLYYEIGGLNVSTGTIVPVETLTSEAPSRAITAVKQGDVLVSTVRPNRKNVGFVIEDTQDIPMVATSGFSVLRFESLVQAAFYHAWLRTDDATSQLIRWNSGSAYPAIDEDVPLHIFVPEFDASFCERLGQTLLDSQFALLHSSKLGKAAKLLVEALIEGQLTEAELLAAEKALQAGNDRLDRFIMSRLNTDGIDGQGPALFGDLDELYHVLTLAEGD